MDITISRERAVVGSASAYALANVLHKLQTNARFADTLRASAIGLPYVVVGYALGGAIRRRLAKDPNAFGELINVAFGADPATEGLRIVALEQASAASLRMPPRETQRLLDAAAAYLRTSTEGFAFRTSVIRFLSADTRAETHNAIADAAEFDVHCLHSAAAAALDFPASADARRRIVAQAISHATHDPRNARTSPGVVQLVLSNGDKTAWKTLRDTAVADRETHVLLRSAAASVDAERLADVIDASVQIASPDLEAALRAIAFARPELLHELAVRGRVDSYLRMQSVAPTEYPEILEDIEKMFQDLIGSARFRAAVSEMIWISRRLKIRPKPLRDQLSAIETAIQEGASLSDTSSVASAEVLLPSRVTNLYQADAIYRDLELDTSDLTGWATQNHWHTGLFLGLHSWYDGAQAEFREVEQDMFHPKWRFVDVDTSSPTLDLGAALTQGAQDLVDLFADGQSYHGRRTLANLSGYQRDHIARQGEAIPFDVSWCFVDMLKVKRQWRSDRGYVRIWHGWLNEIDHLRCDGLVEYAYEKHGNRVCAGTDPDHWNISADLAGVDAHEEQHTFDVDSGELCPRIQAGDQGSDSRFITEVVHPPIVTSFSFFGYGLITFQINAPASQTIFLRITVRQSGGNWYFLEADDYLDKTTQIPVWGTAIGPVRLKEMDKADVLVWIGKTVQGPDYRGVNGQYEFKLVAVDRGGNTSAEVVVKVDVQWGVLDLKRRSDG